MHRRLLPLLIMLLTAAPMAAQTLPICYMRPTYLHNPWVDGTRWCLEAVYEDADAGQLGFTALAAAPDGTLYAARPLAGEIYALTDTDGDGLPDTPARIADGLTLPNGLAFHGDSLYIAGGPHLYRWRAGELVTLVADLPAGGGFWTGGVAVGPDNRLYVSTGAPCDLCLAETAERGVVLSFDLNGGDRQIVAEGLRHPSDLAFAGDQLWTLDTAPDAFETTPNLDELNRVIAGAHFGWPVCLADGTLTGVGDARSCDAYTHPAYPFPTHSSPLGIVAYQGDAFPWMQGTLLVTLGGSNNRAAMEGYALIAVRLDEQGSPAGEELLIPSGSANGQQFSLRHMNYRTSGFWPRRPLDVAISPEGWIYLSAGDGRILALRPLS